MHERGNRQNDCGNDRPADRECKNVPIRTDPWTTASRRSRIPASGGDLGGSEHHDDQHDEVVELTDNGARTSASRRPLVDSLAIQFTWPTYLMQATIHAPETTARRAIGASRTRRRCAISLGRTTKTQMSIETGASSENNCTAVASSAKTLKAHAHRARKSSSHLNKKKAQSATSSVLSAYGRAFRAFRMRSVLVAVRTAAMMPHHFPETLAGPANHRARLT